jgi:DNA-binding PadR family transcriptional regulator
MRNFLFGDHDERDRSFGGRASHPHFGGRGGMFGGPFGGGGFRGGPGMRAAKMLGSGDLQLVVLLLLKERARHGYEIIKAIEEHSSGVYTPSPGMVYPALTFLEESGFTVAAVDGAKKLYSITEEGLRHFETNRTLANEIWTQLGLFGRKFARAQQQFAEDQDLDDHFGGHWRADSRSERHQIKEELRGLRAELKSAILEKIDSSAEEKRRILDVIRRAVDEIRGK